MNVAETLHFSLVLANCDDVIDDMTQQAFLKMSEDLYSAGCDDASPGVVGGEVVIDFDREARDLRDAVRSAIEQVNQAGYEVAEVRPEGYSIFEELNRHLARH